MKCLKESLARLAGRQDKARAALFEERFKSIGIRDAESLLATCAYVDLNLVAAAIIEVFETSPQRGGSHVCQFAVHSGKMIWTAV
jgi:hypothetical protein